jgi:hypothetical protein
LKSNESEAFDIRFGVLHFYLCLRFAHRNVKVKSLSFF